MKMKTIITHSSRFHADDVFAVATLSLLLDGEIKVIRTRDEKLFETGDFVLDVGGVNDEAKNRFDHHQAGGAGKRANGMPYASFGLVWKKFGAELAGSQAAADFIDRKVVQSIDAMDNGLDLATPTHPDVFPYNFPTIVSSFVPTWREGVAGLDAAFLEMVAIAKKILAREIVQAKDSLLADQKIAEAYKNAEDKRLIILDKNYPWDFLIMKYPEPIFVVYPTPGETTWKFGAIRKSHESYESRKLLPAAWAGKRNAELAAASGVPDAVFCHNARFMAVAGSKEGAIALAKLALD